MGVCGVDAVDLYPVSLALLGVPLSNSLTLSRSVYRSIELIDGWEGEIMLNQPLFNFLDGMLMVCPSRSPIPAPGY